MTYEEITQYLFKQTANYEQQGKQGYKEGLQNMQALDERYGHPHQKFKSIHVAGTNGKGSCSHMLAAILQRAGYRVGLYTSPHLVDFSERIRINGKPVSQEYVVKFVEDSRNFFESINASFFEITTAMAFKYFADNNVDIAVVEVGLGGDMTAAYESLEWTEAYHEGRKMTTSCCPAFINMQRQHFPKVFKENVSSIVSPMCAISRYLKKTHPGCVTVFLGPCIAKKSEAADPTIPDNADYVITYGEFRALMRSKGVEVRKADNTYQESSIWGKRFATSGGVAKAVLECMEERGEDYSGIKLLQVAGGDACKKTLTLLKAGRLPEDFVEGMICEGGCVGGPSKHRTEMEIKRAREGLLKQADGRKVLDNLKNYPMDQFSMYRDGHMDEECILK